ncbi:hypothetical protein KSW81_006555 [Nannochloris sp. 'desiccata']|nr:hypothetical protein KSW81_006555 [Chlorella desiccata (nom. nud.)]
MHCGKHLSFKATVSRAATPVVATPLFGCCRLQRPCSTEFYGCRSHSSYPKLPSFSPRDLQQTILPTVSHITRATKDDDAIASQLASADEVYTPVVCPDFPKKKIYPDIENKFFNRKKEYDMITGHLNRKPSKPLLLLGPINSGKSALLRWIVEQEKSRVVYLNCGIESVFTPELMAQQLRKRARMLFSQMGIKSIKILVKTLKPAPNLVGLLAKAMDTASPTGELLNACELEFFPEDTSKDLTTVINTYNLILDNTTFWKKEPIIVIDEFNVLRQWKAKDNDALQNLLEFLKRICKEKKRAHIVLASSDFFMVSWLRQKGFDGTQRKVQVVGDLTSAEAFVYVCGGRVLNRKGFKEEWPGLMAQSKATKELGMIPEDWKKVWSVCGGNMYLLLNCVADATQYNSWDKGVAETLSEPQEDVTTALDFPETIPPPTDSTGPRIWGTEHYKAVLRLIAANPYHAVRRKEVLAALRDIGIAENVTAADVLLSMVEFNVVSLRPYSIMAQDIPREAFFYEEWGVEEKDSVVTMRSPAHPCCSF